MLRKAVGLSLFVAVALGGCGGPSELSREQGEQLVISHERIRDAIATYEKLERSPESADRMLARVREIVASGALEPQQLDEFGLASLGELRLVVPSLAIVDRLEIPRQLDRTALTAFLEHVRSDHSAALKPGAAAEVTKIDELIDGSGAEADTKVPVIDQTVGEYLEQTERELRTVWPDLADDLAAIPL